MLKKMTAVLSFLLAAALFAGAALQRPSTSGADMLRATDEVLRDVSRLRRLAVKQTVKRGLKTRDEIQREVIRDLDESYSPAEFEAARKTLVKLGLIARDFDLRGYYVKLLREQVAGFYQPRTQEFYLAAWLPLSEQKIVIAHELVHALQDQHFNLRRFEKWPKGDADAEFAARSLIEGDATFVMYQYALDEQGRHPDAKVMGMLIEMLMKGDEPVDANRYPALAAAPAVLRESLQFPYSYGAAFVHAVMKSRSIEEINDAYNRLPASSEQIIHPERFLEFDKPVKVELADIAPSLGREWEQVDADINGEFGCQLMLSEFIDKRRAVVAAAGWDGDRYALYENRRTGELLIAIYTTWDTEQDAGEFFDAYSERTEKRYRVAGLEPGATRRLYQTGEGAVSIERRGADVVILEGYPNGEQSFKLAERLWQSRKQ